MDCNVDAECDKGKTETATSKQFSFRKNSSASQSNKNKSSTNDSGKVSDPKKSKDSNHIGRYRLVSTLGRGNFAKVKLAVHLTTGLEVAVKVIDKTQLNAVSLKKLFREVDIMKTLNHPNIVKLYEVIESERHVYLVMEYISKGELFDHLVNFGRMKEKIAREKFRQIVSAIQYCHSKKIVHRDLKAENVLVDADTNMKIADFGFANQFGVSGKLDTFCGSPPYAAPELFQGKRYDGPEVDIWSLGVILYTIVSGSLPFDAHNLKELREKVLRGKYRVPYYLSAECEQLLKKMLILNPDKRHSLSSIMSDKWINTGYENDPLKPFIEPTINYNDPVKINIMYRMGFIDADIRETLQSKKFNNIHATYVILDGYKSLKDLPNAAINQGTAYLPVASSPSATAESKLDSSKVSNKSSPSLTNGKSEKDACTNKKYEQASSITGDSKQQEEDKKKTGTLSWMKQSSSAGPGTTTPTTKKNGDKSSKEGLTSSSIAVDDESSENIIKAAHHQHHRKDKNNLDVNGNDNTLSPLNGGANHLNPSSSSNDTYLVKRNNTFSISDKRTIDDKPLHRATPRLQMNKMPENSFEFNLGEESSYMVNESSDYPNCESDQVRQALLSDPSAKAIVTKTRPATEYNPTMIQKLIRSLSKKKTSNSNNREIESRNVGFNRKDPVRATAPLKQGYNKPRHVSQESLAKDDQAINDTKSITRPENLKHWNGGDINNYVSLAHPEDATVDSSEDASSFQCDKSFLDHSGTMVESVLTAFNKSLCNSSPTNSESKIDPDKYSADVNFDRNNNNKHNNTTPSNECTQVELRLHPSDNDGTLKKNGSLHKKHLAVNNGLKQAASPNHKSENNDPWTPMTNSLYQTPDSSESRNCNQERISSFGRSVRGPPSTSKRGKNLRNLMSCIRSSREKVDTNETSDEVNDTNLLDDKEKLVSSPKKSKNPLMTTGSKVPLYSFRNYINSQIKSNQFDLLKRAIAQELDSHNISYSRSETGFCCQVTECSTQKIRTNFSILLSRGIISSSYGARFKFESGDDKIFQQTKTVLCQKITQKINTL